MTKTYLKSKVNRGLFLALSSMAIFFASSNQANAEQGGSCSIRWGNGCGYLGCFAPDNTQYCILEGDGDCNGNDGCAKKVECTEGQYCVKKDWEVGYNIEGIRQGNRWVCVECADIPREKPLILKSNAVKLEEVKFGQATIDPNLIEY